ncbi:MAG: glycosyltransferase family 2 protein [bacterium]
MVLMDTLQTPEATGDPNFATEPHRPASEPRPRTAWIGPDSRVLALIPHYRCEEWLPDALDALLKQSVPLDGIVVIDDASEVPPRHIVARFPQVTLLQSTRNAGPYALIQAVIRATDYDAYLFNDADDWSDRRRLELLLEGAWEHGAEVVGSQEVRVDCREGEVHLATYPWDVNAALEEEPTSFPLLHPTSLVGRDLVMRLGGFATGMRFSGDAEFLRRATHAARVVNVPHFLYFRRKRSGALTTAPATGLESPIRRRVQATLWRRARENARRVAREESPDLRPLSVAPPVELRYLAGPRLRPAPDRDDGTAAPWTDPGRPRRLARSSAGEIDALRG